MTDNKTCSVDILSVSLGEEGYLIIPRQTRELCEPLVKAADALERALEDLPVDEADKNRIARLSAELMAQAEQYAVELGIQAYLEFTRTLTPEMSVEPWLNKDGAPQLKMTVYQAAGSVQRAQANERAVEWAGRPEAVLC